MITRIMPALKRVGDAPADVYLDDDGNLAMDTDRAAIKTHVRCRLMSWQGEWFLDRAAGVPWVQDLIMGGRFNPILAEAVIKAEILDTEGVKDVTAMSISFDGSKRGMIVKDFDVYTIFDEVK